MNYSEIPRKHYRPSENHISISYEPQMIVKEESIPVGGCVPIANLTCLLAAFMSALWGGGGNPQVNKFEQVSSDDH